MICPTEQASASSDYWRSGSSLHLILPPSGAAKAGSGNLLFYDGDAFFSSVLSDKTGLYRDQPNIRLSYAMPHSNSACLPTGHTTLRLSIPLRERRLLRGLYDWIAGRQDNPFVARNLKEGEFGLLVFESPPDAVSLLDRKSGSPLALEAPLTRLRTGRKGTYDDPVLAAPTDKAFIILAGSLERYATHREIPAYYQLYRGVVTWHDSASPEGIVLPVLPAALSLGAHQRMASLAEFALKKKPTRSDWAIPTISLVLFAIGGTLLLFLVLGVRRRRSAAQTGG